LNALEKVRLLGDAYDVYVLIMFGVRFLLVVMETSKGNVTAWMNNGLTRREFRKNNEATTVSLS